MSGIKTGCVLMAAGNSARFGRNKLFEKVDGREMILRAMDAVSAGDFCRVVVVTQYPRVSRLAQERGFEVRINPHPELGLSGTVKIGLDALKECDGVMFAVADQPFLSPETVKRLCALFAENPHKIALPCANGRRGNPCMFPPKFFSELMELEGDRGGRTVIEAHEDELSLLSVKEKELMDVDVSGDAAERQ